MNFYQQKYFQPYRKVNKDPLPSSYSRSTTYNPPDSYHYDDPYIDSEYKRAPVFQRSPAKHVIHTRTTEEPIWDHLYNQGKKSKQELLDRYENNKYKIDVQCTFQPIIKQNKRYLAHSSSNFLERVNLWQEQKIEKKVKEKEEKVNTDLRQCTFTPKINNKYKKSISVYGEKSNLRADKSQKQLRQRNRNINPYYSPIKTPQKKPALSPSQPKQGVQMQTAMKMIKNELRRLAL